MPRRSSYASVVSGAPIIYQQPSRAGGFSHLLQQGPAAGGYLQQHQPGIHSRSGSRALDIEMYPGAGSISVPASLGRGSNHFGQTNNGAFGATHTLFTPSYLRNSSYVQKLADAHRARLSNHGYGFSTHSSNAGSLSTSSSSANLHKMAPSHRGMTYDIIEKEPQTNGEALMPLPTRWSDHDKLSGIDVLADGLEVRFIGPGKSNQDHDAAAVRADHAMPPQCGIFYYEVTIINRGKEGLIGIGFCGPNVSLNRLPGWEPDSWGYHGDDGRLFCCQSSGKDYGPQFSSNDVVGCGVNFRTGCGFFTKNGTMLGTAFRDIKGKIFPAVGMKKPGEHVRVNFGQSPFVFDIDSVMATEKELIDAEIAATSVASLHPPLNETSLIQALVAQYLAHDGYVETARAFGEEVRTEAAALQCGRQSSTSGSEAKEDFDAINRQPGLGIRTAILEGDIDKALKYTNAYYPTVLRDNEQIYFRLRCRKFIEMSRQCSELLTLARSSPKHSDSLDGLHNDLYDDDVFEQEMELDDQVQNGSDWDRMETEEGDAHMRYKNLTEETLHYGQLLQSEFRGDGRKEVKRALEETFSLLAYEDPKNSVVAHLLEPSGRVPVAEELNSAILGERFRGFPLPACQLCFFFPVSLGKPSSAALERLCQQTEVLVNDIGEDGGVGAFINIGHEFLSC
ncbi:hypothetical protein GP486_007751 [Trichoglossum hirsutum]|uniref:Protein SSH4 n=1 Tax=Trichoglossum hirsutum TaxID=265104 RepID=A0A9P8L2E0_9PEZI|nr:hypothetical protein GP486_007751 [Trichoglossum hirsutum]